MKGTVLVIDDNANLLKSLGRCLTALGWDVITASDPEQAARLYEAVDVVLSDWDMPKGGGARVLKESTAPVVICTGNVDAVVPNEKMFCVIEKPASSSAIDMVLKSAL